MKRFDFISAPLVYWSCDNTTIRLSNFLFRQDHLIPMIEVVFLKLFVLDQKIIECYTNDRSNYLPRKFMNKLNVKIVASCGYAEMAGRIPIV